MTHCDIINSFLRAAGCLPMEDEIEKNNDAIAFKVARRLIAQPAAADQPMRSARVLLQIATLNFRSEGTVSAGDSRDDSRCAIGRKRGLQSIEKVVEFKWRIPHENH